MPIQSHSFFAKPLSKVAAIASTAAICFGAPARAADVYDSVYVGDCLVHSICPDQGRHNVSIVIVPGLNLSSYIFVTTPDGRPGWAQWFAEDGYDVHVINDPDLDFATGGFSVAPFTRLANVVNLPVFTRDDQGGITMGSQETAHCDPVPGVAGTIKLVANPLPEVESNHGDKDVSIDTIFLLMKVRA